MQQFEKHYAHTIHDYNFALDALVLVCSASSDMDKTRPWYYRPMVILRCTCNGAYWLSELDGSVSKLCYAAFQLLPYYTCSPSHITVTCLIDGKALASLELDKTLRARRTNDDSNALTWEGQNLNPQGGVRAASPVASELLEEY